MDWMGFSYSLHIPGLIVSVFGVNSSFITEHMSLMLLSSVLASI